MATQALSDDMTTSSNSSPDSASTNPAKHLFTGNHQTESPTTITAKVPTYARDILRKNPDIKDNEYLEIFEGIVSLLGREDWKLVEVGLSMWGKKEGPEDDELPH